NSAQKERDIALEALKQAQQSSSTPTGNGNFVVFLIVCLFFFLSVQFLLCHSLFVLFPDIIDIPFDMSPKELHNMFLNRFESYLKDDFSKPHKVSYCIIDIVFG